MNAKEMIESYRKLENANVARIQGFVERGEIQVTYMNGYTHTFKTAEDVEAAQRALRPSGVNNLICGALLLAIIGV